MPYIPLLKTNTELAKPQVPALDREKRPQIDVRGVLAGMEELGRASVTPLVEARPLIEAAGAQGHAMGRALWESGDALGAVAQTVRDAIEKQHAHRQEAAIRQTREQQAAAAEKAPDTARYVADVQKGWKQVASKAGGTLARAAGGTGGATDGGSQRRDAGGGIAGGEPSACADG